MKKLLLLATLLCGLASAQAQAPDTPLTINDTTKVLASGTTAGSLTGQVTLQANNRSVIYNLGTGQFVDGSGKAVLLSKDNRPALTGSAKQALLQATRQARAGAYGDNSPAVLAALLKTLIALDPVHAAVYTDLALSGLLGPKTGLTNKGSAITLISGTATNAINDSTALSTEAKADLQAKVDRASANTLTRVSDPTTDVAPIDSATLDTPINEVDPSTISNGSGNGTGTGTNPR